MKEITAILKKIKLLDIAIKPKGKKNERRVRKRKSEKYRKS